MVSAACAGGGCFVAVLAFIHQHWKGAENRDRDALHDPDSIRYSHDSIGRRFRDGRSISSGSGPDRIEACYHDGALYTLNNRSLYSAQLSGRKLTVDIVEKPPDWERRYTTTNRGSSVRIRRDRD